MVAKRWSISRSLVIGSIVSLAWMVPVVAQIQDFRTKGNEVELTQAEICDLQKYVELLLHQQSSRPAKLKDILKPQDALRTAIDALAKLLFNEGSYAQVVKDSTFHFLTGKRRVEQIPHLIYLMDGCEKRNAKKEQSSIRVETIFNLDQGRALIVSIPNSSIAQIGTPQSLINVRASAPAATSELLPPLNQSGAVVVEHNANTGTTEVLALTDGDIEVSDLDAGQTVSLLGGQKVAVRNGSVGEPEEFSLETAYKNDALLAGLGPDKKHDSHLAQEATGVQFTLNLARARTLEALRNQEWRQRKNEWKQGFLGPTRNEPFFPEDFTGIEVLGGGVINPEVTPGVFVRTGDRTATFTDGSENETPIIVDFDDGTITIDGESGISNDAGLSGNNALGTVNLDNGEVRRIEVFGVGGDPPAEGQEFQGTLTEGLAPDQ